MQVAQSGPMFSSCLMPITHMNRIALGTDFWKAAKAAILLEANLYVGVIFNESVFLLVVGVQPRGSIDVVLVEGIQE